MIATTLKTWINAIRGLITSPLTLAIFAALYAGLLATLYWFSATREATVWQVFVTMAGFVVIPAEFFILQAAIVDHARVARSPWKQIVSDDPDRNRLNV